MPPLDPRILPVLWGHFPLMLAALVELLFLYEYYL